MLPLVVGYQLPDHEHARKDHYMNAPVSDMCAETKEARQNDSSRQEVDDVHREELT